MNKFLLKLIPSLDIGPKSTQVWTTRLTCSTGMEQETKKGLVPALVWSTTLVVVPGQRHTVWSYSQVHVHAEPVQDERGSGQRSVKNHPNIRLLHQYLPSHPVRQVSATSRRHCCFLKIYCMDECSHQKSHISARGRNEEIILLNYFLSIPSCKIYKNYKHFWLLLLYIISLWSLKKKCLRLRLNITHHFYLERAGHVTPYIMTCKCEASFCMTFFCELPLYEYVSKHHLIKEL